MTDEFRPIQIPIDSYIKYRESGGLNPDIIREELWQVSIKRKGIRVVIRNGKIYNQFMCKFNNINLEVYFNDLLELSEIYKLTLDGIFYIEKSKFEYLETLINSFAKPIDNRLKFFCFDCITDDNYEEIFKIRYLKYSKIVVKNYEPVMQAWAYGLVCINSFNLSKSLGYDGVVLRNPNSKYKCGYCYEKDKIIYKMEV